MKKQNRFRYWSIFGIAIVFVQLLAGLIQPAPALASGESYQWTDASTIKSSGGDLSATTFSSSSVKFPNGIITTDGSNPLMPQRGHSSYGTADSDYPSHSCNVYLGINFDNKEGTSGHLRRIDIAGVSADSNECPRTATFYSHLSPALSQSIKIIPIGCPGGKAGAQLAGTKCPGATTTVKRTGTWVNPSTISSQGQSYKDGNPDDRFMDYYLNGNSSDKDCVNVIRNFSTDRKTATFFNRAYADGRGGGCRDGTAESITLSEPAKAATAGGVDPKNDGGNGQDNPTCEMGSPSLAWIVCPVINAIADAADFIFNHMIVPLLYTTVDTHPDQPVFQVWSAFRNIANVLLVIFLLIAVYAQATGGGLIDAYTAKKIVPRLVAAVILINLSIYLVAGAVDITNILGKGIVNLIYQPFRDSITGTNASNFTVNPGGLVNGVLAAGIGGIVAASFSATAAGAVGAAALNALPFIMLFIVIPALLAFVGVLVTLIIRQALIVFLIIVAPVACALYCLPNTEQYFKKWGGLLFKTLLVYPIVMVIFAMSNVMSVLLSNVGGYKSVVADIISLILLVLPLFIVPFAFKLAGGAIGNLYGTLAGWGKQGHGFLKGNPNDQNSLGNKVKRQAGEGVTKQQSRAVNAGRSDNAPRWKRAVGLGATMFGNADQRMANYNRMANERREQLSANGNDALIYAGAGWKEKGADGKTTYKDSKGRKINSNLYREGKRLYGGSSHAVAQGLAWTLQKAQTDEDVSNFRTAFTKNAEAGKWDENQMGDVWASATYPHKGTYNSEWYSKPKLNADGSVGFNDISSGEYVNSEGKTVDSYDPYVGDLHKTREAYRLGQLRDGDFRAMLEKQTKIEDKVISGTALTPREATQLAQTYEVFDAVSNVYQRGGDTGEPGAEGTINASTGTAASQPIIEMARKQRQDRKISLRTDSVDQRTILHDNREVGPAIVTGTIDRGGVSK